MKQYLCIDLKSFYASVECVERGLDPMTTNLVVADPERTDKTICLAITPAMKNWGSKTLSGFEIPKGVVISGISQDAEIYRLCGRNLWDLS